MCKFFCRLHALSFALWKFSKSYWENASHFAKITYQRPSHELLSYFSSAITADCHTPVPLKLGQYKTYSLG